MTKLTQIQKALKAPKTQFNNFGKYYYRNCEDILEALKPLLEDCTLFITDEIVMIGNRFYVKATAHFYEQGTEGVHVSASAREEESKKGMDGAQVTGSASSYARKYALNGLFLIDDTKDADSTNKGEDKQVKPSPIKGDTTPPTASETQETAIPDDIPANLGEETPHTNNQVELINENQRKRMFAIARTHGYSPDEIKKYLTDTYGISHSKDIPKDLYNGICEYFEKNSKV